MEQQAQYQVVKSDSIQMVNVEEYAMTPERVVKQVRLIQEVMEKIMKKDEHYGIIPGCEKPSLYKPGAEKLSVTFRLVPRYEIKEIDLPGGHLKVRIVCTLIHAPTGQFFGQGIGSCTTMEGKYRYRNADAEVTEKSVPKKYWDLRKANKMNEAQEMIGGKGFTTKKTDAGWFIAKRSVEKVEHDNPADYYNTVLKMAKKRAHVDAVLTATAASDIFTQDIEDMPEVIPGAAAHPIQQAAKTESETESKHEPIKESPPPSQENKLEAVTKTQEARIKWLCGQKGMSGSEMDKFLDFVLAGGEANKQWAAGVIDNFEDHFNRFLDSATAESEK